MKKLEIFQNDDFGQVRTFVDEEGNPFFCLVDLCKCLDISNSRKCKSSLDQDGVTTSYVIDSMKREQNATFVDEGNLYQVIFQSRKPEAKKFKKWVTREVLPSIRKNGAYLTPEKIEEVLNNPDTIIKLATSLKEEQQKRLTAETKLETTKEINKLQEKELAKQAPKVEYHDKVLQSTGTLTTTQVASTLDISAKKLNKLLEGLGIQYKQSKTWILKHPYKGKGYAKTKSFPFYNSRDELDSRQQLVWTETGRKFIVEKVTPLLNPNPQKSK